jgi:hypothetical protein
MSNFGQMLGNMSTTVILAISFFCACTSKKETVVHWPKGEWKRHTIDDSSQGADGTRFADINGDGLLDITTPWEQGGEVRVYIHPGRDQISKPWPRVTVGQVGDPEDSFFVDLDGDGFIDVVSNCEGNTKTIYVHWSPKAKKSFLDPTAWKTEELSAASRLGGWMYGIAMQVDNKYGIDLIAGCKDGYISWFESPKNPRDLDSWKVHPILPTRWTMTICPSDIDEDGDIDVVVTERRGSNRGALWLENPGNNEANSVWNHHRIGPVDAYEAMHCTIIDLDNDGMEDVLNSVKGGPIKFHKRVSQSPLAWQTYSIEIPENAGGGKAVKVGDIDLDGQLDVAVSSEHAIEGKIGTYWLSYDKNPTEPKWTPHSISGPEGYINDLIQLTDLDGDGDLDVVTVEEKGPYIARGEKVKELGAIWYENPTIY